MLLAHPPISVPQLGCSCKIAIKRCLLASLLLFICLGSGCEGFFVDPTVTAIAVTPQTPSITQNKTQQMAATASYDDGSVNHITSKAIWSTSNPNKVTVSSTGLVTGVSPGSATITTSSANISGSTSVGVTAADLVSIQVSPSSVSALTGSNCSVQRNWNICRWGQSRCDRCCRLVH